MKKATLTIIVIFFCCTVYSQDYYSRTFDFGQKRSEIIWSFETYNNDVFASVGYRCDSVPCSYATSIDPLKGSVEWSKLLPWMDPNGRGITRIGEELYFAGHNLLDSNQFYIYKSSLEGDSLALNSYSAHNQFYFPETGAIQSFDSTLILVGAVRDSNTSVEQTAIALWIENEAVIDSMDFIPGNFSNVVYQVQESIIGEIYFFIFYNELNPSNNRHYQILKFNSNRELIWEWESPVDMELDGNMPPRFLVHSNGNIYMTADPRPNTFDGVWILKPDDELIFKTMSDVFNNRYRITKLKEAKDGGILACGSLDGYYLPEGSLAHIFKMDEEGDLLWERIIAENKNEAFGIPNNITLRDLVELENGDLLFGGRQAVWYYDEDNEPRGQNDAWLLRTNSDP